MKLSGVGASKQRFGLGWAVDAHWPGLQVDGSNLAAAIVANVTFSRGQTTSAVVAHSGASLERFDGRIAAQIGVVSPVNEQIRFFSNSPRLKQPLASRYVNPESMMRWWEFSSRFQNPGAAQLALWHGLRVVSAASNQWNINSPVAVSGLGFGVGFDGAGNLRVYTKRLAAAGNCVDLGGVALPAGLTATDWLRWGYALIAATPTRPAKIRLYVENALIMERAFDADGTGATNSLPDYEAVSGNGPAFVLALEARSDNVAGVSQYVTDVRFRMGRYDVNGVELPTT